MAAYFTASSREPRHRHREQVAQRADVGLAGDRVAGDHRDGQRQEQPISIVSAASATKRPFSVIERKKSGASAARAGDGWLLTAIEMSTGTAASTTQPGQVAAAAEDQPQLGAQEPRRHAAAARRRRARTVTSATDIEALPGERDEDVLQGGRVDHEPA